MYHTSESEFMQYEMAERRLKDLKRQHAAELQQAYDGIHPTRTCFDYAQGSVYVESVNPADYAIYLVELREDHKHAEKWWRVRAEAYEQAVGQLTEEERQTLNFRVGSNYYDREKCRKRLREILSEIVETRPDLQRKYIPLDEIEDMEEVDRRIDKMSIKELLEDYWDLDEQLNEERLKEQCIRLYDTHDMPYSEIGRLLGIKASRAKRYVKQHQEQDELKAN